MYLMTDFLAGYVVRAGAGLAGDPGVKASRHSTDGTLSVFETSRGAGPTLHVHDREDKCFYVHDGGSARRHAQAVLAAGTRLLRRGNGKLRDQPVTRISPTRDIPVRTPPSGEASTPVTAPNERLRAHSLRTSLSR
jgi:hypothetical protein